MTEHKQRAEDYSLLGGDNGEPGAGQIEGLVHAVLYLAQQQKIANRIAFVALDNAKRREVIEDV